MAVLRLPNRLDNFMALLAHPGIDVNKPRINPASQVNALLDTSFPAFKVNAIR
jgi:hypothetical protein